MGWDFQGFQAFISAPSPVPPAIRVNSHNGPATVAELWDPVVQNTGQGWAAPPFTPMRSLETSNLCSEAEVRVRTPTQSWLLLTPGCPNPTADDGGLQLSWPNHQRNRIFWEGLWEAEHGAHQPQPLCLSAQPQPLRATSSTHLKVEEVVRARMVMAMT